MVNNIDYENLISVGFVNSPERDPKLVDKFLQSFDIVIVNDGSMKTVNEVL